ncbi:hypothetical protein CRYUN_Cryun26dG0105300 [Craigia yunnanensis]
MAELKKEVAENDDFILLDIKEEYSKLPYKTYESLSYLLGKEYFLHAYGPIYALSADVVASLVTLRCNSFRMFSNEDVTIGAWILAMNVNHEDNRALCEPDCTPSFVAVWDIPKCSGWCPFKAYKLVHQYSYIKY